MTIILNRNFGNILILTHLHIIGYVKYFERQCYVTHLQKSGKKRIFIRILPLRNMYVLKRQSLMLYLNVTFS